MRNGVEGEMSAAVISLIEERQRKRRMERLARQVEKDLERVLSLLKPSLEKLPESRPQPA